MSDHIASAGKPIKPVKAWAGVRNGVFLFFEFKRATAKIRIQQEWQVTAKEFEKFGFSVIPVTITPDEGLRSDCDKTIQEQNSNGGSDAEPCS